MTLIINAMGTKAQITLLKCHEVAKLLGVTRKTVHRYVEGGIIPAPVQDPANGYGYWKLSDVDVARRALVARAHKENR
jgi:DNA-binding transcriptional MerR regulator